MKVAVVFPKRLIYLNQPGYCFQRSYDLNTHCTSAQQSGGKSTLAIAKANRQAAECLQKKHHRAEETTEEHAMQLQSILRKVQPSRLHSCSSIKLALL